MKFDILAFFSPKIFRGNSSFVIFRYNLLRITCALHEDQCIFFIISRSVPFRIKNVSDKSCRGNQNTHFVFSNFSFENLTFYEIMWKYFPELDKPPMTIWRMRIACWIPKATNTHSGYVILIAYPLQQWLEERSSIFTLYVQCPSCCELKMSVLKENCLLGRYVPYSSVDKYDCLRGASLHIYPTTWRHISDDI
jgi:hypothetical protein